MTTRTGTVSLWFLPDGGGLIRLQKIGFAAQILFVAVSPTDTASITFTLQRLTQLAPVVTTAGAVPSYISPALRGFEERRRSASATSSATASLAGVEWYPDGASVPSEFNHISGRCGALLLWTRER